MDNFQGKYWNASSPLNLSLSVLPITVWKVKCRSAVILGLIVAGFCVGREGTLLFMSVLAVGCGKLVIGDLDVVIVVVADCKDERVAITLPGWEVTVNWCVVQDGVVTTGGRKVVWVASRVGTSRVDVLPG